jgi:hypothetical protein
LIIYTWKILNVALGKEELVFTYVWAFQQYKEVV